ncbi:MAG: helix-hairpin-helix domain-containing protein [Dehalococcoidia bacterium]|nr:helix-hairpin-helix domain-containing protein [Dehalococcoidia bacterium]
METLAQMTLLCLFVAVLTGAVVVVIKANRPSGVEVLLPTPTPQPTLQVHIAGAVAKPGRYILPLGARVGDALTAAGGPLEGADLEQVNLARPLSDGEKVTVPLAGQKEGVLARESLTMMERNALLDLNTADASALEALPGIGPVLAQRIVEYRMRYGPFAQVEDLLKVQGIGPKILERIRPLVTVR